MTVICCAKCRQFRLLLIPLLTLTALAGYHWGLILHGAPLGGSGSDLLLLGAGFAGIAGTVALAVEQAVKPREQGTAPAAPRPAGAKVGASYKGHRHVRLAAPRK